MKFPAPAGFRAQSEEVAEAHAQRSRHAAMSGAAVLFLAGVIGLAGYFVSQQNISADKRSIVVLPFLNGSGNPDISISPKASAKA